MKIGNFSSHGNHSHIIPMVSLGFSYITHYFWKLLQLQGFRLGKISNFTLFGWWSSGRFHLPTKVQQEFCANAGKNVNLVVNLIWQPIDRCHAFQIFNYSQW